MYEVPFIKYACALAEYLFPGYKYKWISQELRDNIRKEVNLIREGDYYDFVRFHYKDHDFVVVNNTKIISL